MIDRHLKRSLGQMMKGVQVVTAAHDGVVRGYCSHWVTQISFDEPILMASVSPKHDTHPLMVGSGRFAVSILAGDQVDIGQYFSYPGRKFEHIATEYLHEVEDDDGRPWSVVPEAVAWLGCEVIDHLTALPGVPDLDHDLFVARVAAFGEGRLGENPLLYSSRLGWRVSGGRAREPGDSVRDRLLARLEADDGPEDG